MVVVVRVDDDEKDIIIALTTKRDDRVFVVASVLLNTAFETYLS